MRAFSKVWRDSVMVTALDWRSRGRGFESSPFHMTLGKFTCASVTKQYNLVLAKVMAAYRWVYDLSPAG